MTNQHPITPPLELVKKWVAMLEYCEDIDVFTDVARWGADQELEACAKEVSYWSSRNLAERLRDCRRPKPPSLKDKLKEAIYNENLGEALRLVEQLDDSL